MVLQPRPFFRKGQERKEFSLLGKTENRDGVAPEAFFRKGQERKGFSLLGKTENGDGVAPEAFFRNGQERKGFSLLGKTENGEAGETSRGASREAWRVRSRGRRGAGSREGRWMPSRAPRRWRGGARGSGPAAVPQVGRPDAAPCAAMWGARRRPRKTLSVCYLSSGAPRWRAATGDGARGASREARWPSTASYRNGTGRGAMGARRGGAATGPGEARGEGAAWGVSVG